MARWDVTQGTCALDPMNRICGVVGYHVRFTRGRSPVRTRTDVSFFD